MGIRFKVLAGALALALTGGVWAQAFPSRPVKIVVPYPSGGAIDIMARQLAGPMQQSLGQPVVVENRAGSGGLIGHGFVAKSAPDGHTLVIAAAGPVAASLKLYKSMPYDATKDFASVGMVGDVDVVVVAGPALKATTVDDVLRFGRERPGELRFAINSPGSLHHLLTEHLLATTRTSAIRVPYKGAGQAVIDLIGGQTHVQVESLPVVAEHIKSGRLTPLAAATTQRIKTLPDLKTLDELGFKGMAAAPWYALLAPAGTPKDVIARLNRELNKALAEPAIATAFERIGARVISTTPEETDRFIRSETERWGRIVAETGVKIEE